MPGFNRTGPLGQGPVTGRGLGLCNGYAPGPGWGRGGMGRGFGRGMGFGWRAVPYGAAEVDPVQAGLETLKQQRDALNQRIAELEKNADEQ